ncbi:adaptor protein MecA [Evansella cellulosilytica]|uniref:Adapter protein MecA n=1 Tax=Evansella cellulosilytica (strain ATCC 21833 / DSM 2522 / FERM P-1141 / JCM 9156 / N-4) TaxID=649639 RepID=E6TX65_EVAC2|nr:adaptor protein MecA [Evansella cellulosilytica]ADU31154.1 Negative regulator of genetic competence [Evansella cellulosilytica DSM 2522]
MEIERINDTTIKFYITYHDMERRGFHKDEIWYNRERGEELFFEMMNEANDQESFELNGPLWVQVHALEKGLEIIVTRGQMSGDGNLKLEIPMDEEKDDMPVDNNIVDMLDSQFAGDKDTELVKDHSLSVVLGFKDLEDIISLSHVFYDEVETSMYSFEGVYYVYVTLDETYTDDEQDNLLSRMLEYGYESDITIHRISEYGKEIFAENALSQLRSKFS